MFPGMPVQTNKEERKLVKILKSLDSSDKENLIAFAEFLQVRSKSVDDLEKISGEIANEPIDIPRPESESVIHAIKRLGATYPMVNKEDFLHPISDLMTSHIIQGKEATDVIDQLQGLFENEYKNINNFNTKIDTK